MRDRWSTRYYVDILCGPGKNRIRENNEVVLGSPLIALQTRFPFTHYFFSDLEESNTSALTSRCTASPYNDRVTIRTGDCNTLVEEVVEVIGRVGRSSLNLAFLDPQGLELRWETVRKLASLQRMDLIINYPQNALVRNMKQAAHAAEDTAVDRFFGGREWRTVYLNWENGPHVGGIHRHMIDFYKHKLQSLGYKDVRNSDEFTNDEPLMRNVERNAPLYRLLFASKHALGVGFWQKVTRRNPYGQDPLF